MPEPSTIEDFVEAIRTGESEVTKRLTYLWNNYGTLDQKAKDAIDGFLAGAPNHKYHPKLDDPIVDLLTNSSYGPHALESKHINHIEKWPPSEKNKVRSELQSAGVGTAAEFWWEVFRDSSPAAASKTAFASGPPLEFVFQTPGGRVKKTPALGFINTDPDP